MKKQFTVYGRAVPKARPRVTKSGHTYTPKTTKEYEARVQEAYRKRYGMDMFPDKTPLAMLVEFSYTPPKSWSKVKREKAIRREVFPTSRPDVDNLLKSIEDALNGVAYRDDSQIVALTSRKVYGKEDKAKIMIWSIYG